MYNFVDTRSNTTAATIREPTDNLLINGVALSKSVPGYRQLSVSGRGLVGRTVSTTAIAGRRGVWVDRVADKERVLTIKYLLTATTSSELRDRFAKLNAVLRTVNSDSFLVASFADETDYEYQAILSDVGDFAEDSLTIISEFSFLVPDGYKKKKAQTSTNGTISLVDATEVLPEQIIVKPNGGKTVSISSSGKTLTFTRSGNYATGSNITITWKTDEITATHGSTNILNELQLFSPLETFRLKNGRRVTVSGGTLVSVTWRDERL